MPAAQPRTSFSGPVPWHRFVAWEESEGGGCLVERGKFRLLAWPEKGPPALWKGLAEFEGKMIGECVCARPGDDATNKTAIQRALVKLAVFHGMPLEPALHDMVAPLLVDPTDDDKTRSRRVGIDGRGRGRIVVPGKVEP